MIINGLQNWHRLCTIISILLTPNTNTHMNNNTTTHANWTPKMIDYFNQCPSFLQPHLKETFDRLAKSSVVDTSIVKELAK